MFNHGQALTNARGILDFLDEYNLARGSKDIVLHDGYYNPGEEVDFTDIFNEFTGL